MKMPMPVDFSVPKYLLQNYFSVHQLLQMKFRFSLGLYIMCVCQSLSRVQLFVTPKTVAYQRPLSMEFSRQKHWSGYPLPSPGDLPDPGIKPRSPVFQADSLQSEQSGIVRYNCKKKKRTIFLYHLVISEVPIAKYFTDFAVFVHLFPIMKSELSLTIWMNCLPTHSVSFLRTCRLVLESQSVTCKQLHLEQNIVQL